MKNEDFQVLTFKLARSVFLVHTLYYHAYLQNIVKKYKEMRGA